MTPVISSHPGGPIYLSGKDSQLLSQEELQQIIREG